MAYGAKAETISRSLPRWLGFGSENIWSFNHSLTHEQVREEFRRNLGIDSLIVVESIEGDVTHHIDMFCKLLNDTLFLVGEYAEPSQGYPGDFETSPSVPTSALLPKTRVVSRSISSSVVPTTYLPV